ncbi:MAG: SDR family oxidoreductase [Deltaproteobacteria bacterium]|nr:SDR family oxidoreductase [Deltaproteobacteria bacterium]
MPLPDPSSAPGGDAVTTLSRVHPRVFVTGAAGFIGSHVVKRLVDLGVEVTALVIPGDPAPSLAPVVDRIRIVRGDLSALEPLAAAMREARAGLVIHLAAIYALWLREPRAMFDVNVQGTRNVLGAARAAGVPRVVHTSSIAAVGVLPGEAVADEDTPFNEWDVANDYVLSKYISELEAFRMAGPDLEVVAVNPAFPFGADDTGPTPTGKMVLDTLRGRLPFVIQGGFNAVDVRDVAEGHLLGALHGVSGRRYILGGHNVSFRDFADRVAAASGRRPPPLTLPTPFVRRAGRVSELVANHVTRRPPMFTERSVAYMAGRYSYFSTARAQRELGYRPRPLDEAIRASIDWFSRPR